MKGKYYDDINLGILKYIPSDLNILDVGCGTGLLGNEIKKKRNYVCGIDFSEPQLALASERLDNTIKADITKEIELFEEFDMIVFADILEHLEDPTTCLKRFKKYLKDGGRIIISLPNVACYNVRLSLLFGQFNYKKYGILDNTHLRFYTKKTAMKLVKDSGYKIIKIDTTPYLVRPLFHLYKRVFFKNKKDEEVNTDILQSKMFKLYSRYIFPIENLITKIWSGLLAYQFIIIAERGRES